MSQSYLHSLTTFICEKYDMAIHEIFPSKRGFFGETWQIKSLSSDYFVKIDYWNHHKELYRNSFQCMNHIIKSGIDYIPKIIPTKKGDLYADFNTGVMGIFDYIEGENTENYPIQCLFERLVPIYHLNHSNVIGLEYETFDTVVIDKFAELKERLETIHSETAKQLIGLFAEKEKLLERYAKRLEIFSSYCKPNLYNFCITHGDAGGNCILNGDHITIIDWDYPKVAPIERDAWFFMCNKNQTEIINSVLKNNSIDYVLNFDRFCYYSYYSFFYYLTEYLMTYFDVISDDLKQKVTDSIISYFDSWIMQQLAVADNNPPNQL